MKGNWAGFSNQGTSGSEGGLVNGKDYNSAGSKNVGTVNSVSTYSNAHDLPSSSKPNSVSKNYKNGKLNSERYYGKDGKAYLDIDYSNHGNPKMHPVVPHEHKITFINGKMYREKGDGLIS